MTLSVQEISDRLEIQDILVAYSYAIDEQDWDALDQVFTPDAIIDYSAFGGGCADLATTKQFLAGAMPGFPHSQHMVSTSRIVVNGDTARAESICHNPMPVDDGDAELIICGLWYEDDLVSTAEGWRIARRVERKSYMWTLSKA